VSLGSADPGHANRKHDETKMPAEDNTIQPFRIGFPDAELTELRRRVNATRWPERETVTDVSIQACG
jgi:hypothetical protein